MPEAQTTRIGDYVIIHNDDLSGEVRIIYDEPMQAEWALPGYVFIAIAHKAAIHFLNNMTTEEVEAKMKSDFRTSCTHCGHVFMVPKKETGEVHCPGCGKLWRGAL